MTTQDGRMLGRYQLLFMLGQGGMGEVHLARLTGAAGFEKLCIVKTVLPNLMGDQNFIDRFHHEARVLVQLTHSNIAQVYDMGEVEQTLYMAIEYVPGVDLSRVETRVERQATQMPISTAVFIGQKINEALGYAHRKVGADGMPLGIVHRDVSPQNVMVSYEGEVKVIDFGLAKSSARSKHTLPSTVMGKLGYMSPEQALAKPVDHRSDIFSSGIVVWEMLAGRSMYQGGTMSEMVAQMAVAEVPSLRSARPDISPTLEQVVMRALAKDPAARYQRADDFARALNELAVREQMSVSAEDVGNYVRAMCPEEFAAERQLQSKLSVLRRKGAAVQEVASQPELEGTFMRPSEAVKANTASGQFMTPAQRAVSVLQPSDPNLEARQVPAKGRTIAQVRPPSGPKVAHQPTPTPRPQQQQQEQQHEDDDAPLVVPKSKTPLIIAALVVLIAVAGGALYVMQPKDGPTKDPVVAVKDPVVQKDPEPVKEPVKAPEPVKDPEPEPVAKDPEPAPVAATESIVVDGKVWKVLRKDDEVLMLLDKKDKVNEGDRINLVGEPGEDGKRPLYGRAAVLSVKGSLATLIFDGDGKMPDKLYAALDGSPKRPTVVKKDPVTRPTEPVKNADPVVVARKDPEPEPVKKDPEPVKKDPEPVKPAVTQLFGTVRLTTPNAVGNRVVMVRNQNQFSLSNCELRLPSNVVYKFGKTVLSGNQELKLAFKEFRVDARPPDPQFKADWAAMYCREGTGYWKTTYERR